MQRGKPAPSYLLFQLRPDIFILRQIFGEHAGERAVVEWRAADQQRYAAAGHDAVHGVLRILRKVGGGIYLIGIDDVDEMMYHLAPYLAGDLVSADVKIAVDLARVDRDYLSVELRGERQAELRLADRRGADYRDNGDLFIRHLSNQSRSFLFSIRKTVGLPCGQV